MNPSEIAERAARFYKENATNVVNVPRPGHPEDKSGLDGVRRASEARFVAPDALVMTLADAFDFAAKFAERAIEESRGQRWIPVEEKLPDENQIVLVFCPETYATGQLIEAMSWSWDADSKKVQWYEQDGDWDGREPTHWQPLADPPKGNENV